MKMQNSPNFTFEMLLPIFKCKIQPQSNKKNPIPSLFGNSLQIATQLTVIPRNHIGCLMLLFSLNVQVGNIHAFSNS